MANKITSKYYSKEDLFSHELKTVFKSSWIFFGLKSDFSKKIRVIDKSIINQPVFVSNINDNLKAYYNVCPHRGSKIVKNNTYSGSKKNIVCPYHAWSFEIESGNCTNVDKHLLIGNEKSCTSLKSIKVDTVGNFIFLLFSNNSDLTLKEYLGDVFQDLLIATDILDFTSGSTQNINHKCNWKHIVENVIDNKHCTVVHQTTLADMGFCENKPITTIHGFHNDFIIYPDENKNKFSKKKKKLLNLIYRGKEIVDYYKHILIFPNLTISVFEGVHYTVGFINPINSLETIFETRYYHPHIKENSVKESMEKAHKDSALEIFGEDVEMLNSLGENLFLAGFEGEHYKDETRIRHFNETYLKSIK